MKALRIRRLVLVTGVLAAVGLTVLSWERMCLIKSYYDLVSDSKLNESLRREPRFEKIVRKMGGSVDDISLGYAVLSPAQEATTRVSAEEFPRVIMHWRDIRLCCFLPDSYGAELYDWWLKDRQSRYTEEISKMEEEVASLAATDPYEAARRKEMAMPLAFGRIVIMPKRELRMYVLYLHQKCFSKGQSVFFDGGSLKGVYEALDESGAGLKLYDHDRKLFQVISLTGANAVDRLQTAREIAGSFRFTVDSLPEQREKLLDMICEAIRKLPGFDADSWKSELKAVN